MSRRVGGNYSGARFAFSTRRPSRSTCPNCGEPIWLVDCGVPEHRATRTRREQSEGRCPGRVYVHQATGGIECDERKVEA